MLYALRVARTSKSSVYYSQTKSVDFFLSTISSAYAIIAPACSYKHIHTQSNIEFARIS